MVIRRSEEVEAVVERALLMRENLRKCQRITDSMVGILGSFSRRLSLHEGRVKKKEDQPQSSNRKKKPKGSGFSDDDDLDDEEIASPGRKSSLDELFLDDELDDDDEDDGAETSDTDFMTRTHAIQKAHDNIDQSIRATDLILTHFDVSRQVEPKILEGPQEDISTYLGAVDKLKTNVDFFNFHRSFQTSDAAFKHASNLLSKAMAKIEERFRDVLTQHSSPVEPSVLQEAVPSSLRPPNAFGASAESAFVSKVLHAGSGADKDANATAFETSLLTLPAVFPAKVIPQLAEMARRMVNAHYHETCIKAYREIRQPTLESSLRKLGVGKVAKEDVQKMPWEVLEPKIGSWIRCMKISVKMLFAAERKVCDQVFYHLDPHREQCFYEIAEPNFSFLISFGDSVSRSKRSPEKLLVLLDMYEAIRELLPEIDMVFSGELITPLREEAAALFSQLAEAAKDTFDEFLDAIEKDFTKTPVQDGTVHPLTSYVINYLKFLFVYQNTIRHLYEEDPGVEEKDSVIGQNTQKAMLALRSNLELKTKQYKDPALVSIFLMNNIDYIVRLIQRQNTRMEAKDLLGEEWMQAQREIVQQHASDYQQASWEKVLQCLSGEGLSGVDVQSLRQMIKERFKNFNLLFEEIVQRQSQWSVPDRELRLSVRLAVSEALLPVYQNFTKRYGGALEGSKNPQKYLRYTTEDVERLLGDLFEGKDARRRSQVFG